MIGRILELRFLGHGLFDGHLQLIGNQLGHFIDLAKRDVESTAHITDNPSGLHRTVGDNLGHMIGAAIFLPNIINDFTTPFLTEIDIEVRHRFSFDIEKTLKDKAVRDGIDIGDEHAVGGKTSGTGPSAGADRNMPVFWPR